MPQTRLLRWFPLAAALGAGAFAPAAAAITPARQLEDSTFVQNWKLDNGLRVAARHIPGAAAVAITVAYDLGGDDDPPGREGLAMLLGELGFTAAAGDIPERNREDLDSQRPNGWSFTATRRSIMFTEVASPDQFPGVIQQVATRMGGVTVTRDGLRAALANVRLQMEQRISGPVESVLYHLVREAALGRGDAAMLRATPGRELDKLTPEAVRQQLQRLLVPANAALSVSGNLEGIHLPTLVQNLFGSLPAGTPVVRGGRDSLRAGVRSVVVPQAQARRGAIGILAPPLTDPGHPSFYLSTMLLSTHFNRMWIEVGNPNVPAPVTGSLFHYALFDEPDLVRLFPPGAATTDDLATVLKSAIEQLYATVIPDETFDQMRSGLVWLLGGPMTEDQRKRARRDPSAIHTLSRSMAGRELFGGETVWAPYREAFSSLPTGGLQTWMDYYGAAEHQMRLMTIPKR